MLELDDYRKSRIYQEARQDGIDEGKAEVIRRMASKGFDVKQISDLVGVDTKSVQEILKP